MHDPAGGHNRINKFNFNHKLYIHTYSTLIHPYRLYLFIKKIDNLGTYSTIR
jgi:hypothetical protein